MATIELTKENFNDIVGGRGTIVIDFWADWCGPCRMFAPVFEQAARRYPEITFGTVDTAKEAALAKAFGVNAVPTLMVVRDGVVLYSRPGALPGPSLDKLISTFGRVDMDQVRASMARSA